MEETRKQKLVFIVEDNDMYSLMLDYMLSKESTCIFERYKTGEECIANLSKHPDLIILDYGLPGMNGLETYKGIKKFDPKIPVVVLTQNHDVRIAQEFMKEGGLYEYLLKETDSVQQITSIIDKLLVDNKKHQSGRSERNKLIIKISIGILILILIAIWINWLKHRT